MVSTTMGNESNSLFKHNATMSSRRKSKHSLLFTSGLLYKLEFCPLVVDTMLCPISSRSRVIIKHCRTLFVYMNVWL